ncbi:VOC family protein [Aeromonas caviae]|uniref:VOC family protein n=1 Tax=Aeromonas caviae TaxID=648 RepID=UPI0038D03BBD
MNIAIHFEIPVQDMERAIRFYEGVFETVLERVQIDGNEMALFPLESGTAGCSGALAKGESYVPSLDGTRIYLRVPDIEGTMARALASGGACLYPVTRVGESLRVAECRDCEGNRIALQEGT